MVLQRVSTKEESHLFFQSRYAKWAGSLLFFGGAVVWLVDTISESLYPKYSVMRDALSTLGEVHSPTRWLWNSATILLGVLWLVGVVLLFVRQKQWLWLALNLLPPIGVLLVGLFPAGSVNTIHPAASYVIFTASGVVMVVDALVMDRPFRFFSVLLGAISLGGLGLSTTATDVLGAGGEERMIVYPLLIWLMSFGGALMAQPSLLPGAKEHPTSATEAAPAPQRPLWERRWIPGAALGLALIFSSLSLIVPLLSGNANQPRLRVRFDCPVTSGSASSCTLTLTNPPQSAASAQWKLSSASPVQFSSSSGSLEVGHSTTITLTLPGGLCSFSVTLTERNASTSQTIPIDACPQSLERPLQTSISSITVHLLEGVS